jgi:uncharacterized protein
MLNGCVSNHAAPVTTVQTYGVNTSTAFSTDADNNAGVAAPKQIALLLPLQGNYADVGRAVRDGFLTAYNAAPTAMRPAHIDIINTSGENILTAYQQAINQGADFIIGPLTKSDVQTLAQSADVTVPTLALNYLDNNQTAPAQLYQFGLSPFDEARQAAALARQQGQQSALIIAPSGVWGASVAQAFQDQWQALGGTITDKLFFTDTKQTLSTKLRNFLHYNQVDKKTPATRRQDFDVIFLAADTAAARQIKPLLKYFYAGDVPVYATSLVYAGTPQPGLDNDLNGIIFCDAPWALGEHKPHPNLQQRLALFWPLPFQQNTRLYALGVDAYYIAAQLNELAAAQKNLPGASGLLSLNDQHRIVRQLECAQFHNGVPGLLE